MCHCRTLMCSVVLRMRVQWSRTPYCWRILNCILVDNCLCSMGMAFGQSIEIRYRIQFKCHLLHEYLLLVRQTRESSQLTRFIRALHWSTIIFDFWAALRSMHNQHTRKWDALPRADAVQWYSGRVRWFIGNVTQFARQRAHTRPHAECAKNCCA